MNQNMNEQDMILNQKIEKREKFDTILAYVLLVILLGAIILVLCLKFLRKEDDTIPEEYVPNYISLIEISESLNNSILANRFLNDGVTFSSSVSGNVLLVNYTKDDTNISLNATAIGNELVLDISNENTDIVTDIYKEVASIVCVYYGNQDSDCRSTLDNINGDSVIDGIRFESGDNTSSVYIDMTKSIDVNNETIYNTVTQTSINDTNYSLNLLDIKISNINIVNSGDSISFTGNVEGLNSDNFNFSLVVKLFDTTGNLLGENSLGYNEENPLDSKSTFAIEFMSNEINISDVSEYSIEIVK